MYYTANSAPEKSLEAWASLVFVALSVVIGVIGFFAKGVLPGVLMTIGLGVMVLLLSRAVTRCKEAIQKGHYFTAVTAGFLAVGFGCMEANLNHIGLENLNDKYDLAPDLYIWPACFFISLVNVFASYAFGRELEDKRKPQPSLGKQLADLRWEKEKRSQKAA